MRGKAVRYGEFASYSGITPAYAGKRKTRSFLSDTVRDHPRLCGEKSVLIICTLPYQGSPPPMRGKAKLNLFHPCYCGITPAYAGKSFTVSAISASVKDHPRLCGEKDTQKRFTILHEGSPPPMRGKGTFGVDTSTTTGITPAYAGKSMIGENAFYGTGDHPRLCGEKVGILIVQLCQLGSPPPMRGKGFFCRHSIIFTGITPAYAGKRLT